MPGATGIRSGAPCKRQSHVVFITAHDDYAVAAFEQGAIDYILKPICEERVKLTIGRLRDRLREPRPICMACELLKSTVAGEARISNG